jgi:EmrB/QacA subfamily drug resistance transporter
MQTILVFVSIELMWLLTNISSTAVSVAFPNITMHFNTSLVLAGWLLSIYQIVAACSMVIMGKVSDVLGCKNTFLICSGLFLTASLLAALAPNIQLLIIARFIQSIGGGGSIPVAVGIIVEMFPLQRQKLIGIGMSIANFGGIIGPNVGSWLVTSFGWQSIFWFNIPIVVLAAIPIFFLFKSNKRETIQIDYTGAGLLSAFLFAFMIGLSQIAQRENNLNWLITGALFVASISFLVVFVRHELKTRDPVIDLELLRLKPFAAANVYNFVYGACVFGFTSFIPLYAVSVYGMTTIESGYVLTTRAIGFVAAAMAGGFIVVKWGYHKPMLLGSIIISGGLFLFAFEFGQIKILGTEINPILLVSAITLIMGLGMGIASAASSNACLNLIPNRVATIQGTRGMFRQSGGAISIAVTTLILQFAGNKLSLGFTIVFISTGLVVLLTIPFILAMPDRDSNPLAKEK